MADESKKSDTKDSGGKKKYVAIATKRVGSDSKGNPKIQTVRGKETPALTKEQADVYRAHKLIE